MSPVSQFNQTHLSAFGSNWQRFLALGIILLLLGVIAIMGSVFTTMVSVIFIGLVIFLGGILIAFDTVSFWWRKGHGFFLHLILAILYLFAGCYLMFNPVAASISLTFLLGVFYIVIGMMRIISVGLVRAPQWGWSLFSGIISVLLGILILESWPASGLFIIGLFVGIDLVFVGWTYIMAALAGKSFAAAK